MSKQKYSHNKNLTSLCEYGCEQVAKYILHFSNKDKLCCNKKWQSCPNMKKQQSLGNKGKPAWNKGKTGFPCTEERKQKLKISVKLNIEKIKERYPFFYKIKEMRYDPDKPDEKNIQTHCKNKLCANSKEQGGWFTPKKAQLQSRIYALEKSNGNGGRYLYCCDECKSICPLYNLHPSYVLAQNDSKLVYTDIEYQLFKKEVLKRQEEIIGRNECEICGSIKDLHVHHIIPQKIEPYFSLDPDNGIVFCGPKSNNCHNKYGHKNDCSSGYLSTLICQSKRRNK